MRAILWRALVAVLAALPHAIASAAEAYPQRPLRLIVPFTPGGPADAVARMVAQRLGDTFGQHVLVDNRPGGGTIIATELGARAAPDGHTLLVVSAAFTVNPSLYRKLPYDTEKDFSPVTQTWGAPNLLIVNPQVPASSVKELIAYARSNPRKLNFGSAGNGTSNHLAGEMFRTMAGIDIVHVPYKGDAPAIADLIAGQIQMYFVSLLPVAQHVKTGRLKALAVSSASTFPLAPELPTVASGGVPGFSSFVWNGIVAPGQTPVVLVNRLQAEIARILAQAEVREKMLALGVEPIGTRPSEFREFITAEIKRSAKVVSDAGVRID